MSAQVTQVSATRTSSTAQSPTTTTTTTQGASIRYNNLYLSTVPGTLKVVCLVFALLGFFSILISRYSHIGKAEFYSTVAMICFWFTGILLVLYLFQVVYVFSRIPWSKIEFYFCLTATLFLMLVSSLVAAQGDTWLTIAAFFGYVAMCAYGYDTFLKYRLFGTTTTIVSQRTTVVSVA